MPLYNMDMKIEVPPAEKYYDRDFFSDKNLEIKVLHMEISREYPPHSHDFYELVFVYSGKGTHRQGSREEAISPGSVIFIPIGREHSYIDNRNLSYINILFSKDVLPRLHLNPEEFLLTRITEYDMTRIIDTINRIDRETYRREYGYESCAKALLETVLIHIVRAIGRRDYLQDRDIRLRIEGVVGNVQRNLSLSYTLGELAEMADTGPRNFSRIFRQIYGTTPFKFINRSRIEESLSLLENGKMTITQIASLVGFDDSSYYSLLFKAQRGESPSEYRRRMSLSNSRYEL